MRSRGTLLLIIFFSIAVALIIKDGLEDAVAENATTFDIREGIKPAPLTTDTSRRSIDLEAVLNGGPGKDGIPALNNPDFVSVDKANEYLPSDALGILVEHNNEARFYPYSLMVWHEVVNDQIDDQAFVVTFCPLCGTAIVFDARTPENTHTFGVSGKLYESNLLMYDRETESLWSQAMGEAVIGELTGITLTRLPFQLIRYAVAREDFQDLQIMSSETGYQRNYNFYPYGNYEENETLYFPISVRDTRLPTKQLVYAFEYSDVPYAVILEKLSVDNVLTHTVSSGTLRIRKQGEEITITTPEESPVPGYYSMWFSWATHHHKTGVVIGLD